MVVFLQKKTFVSLTFFLAVASCGQVGADGFGFDATGARTAIDAFKAKFTAMDFQTPQLKLQALNTGLQQVKSSPYYATSQSLQSTYQSTLDAYNQQNNALASLEASAPKQSDLDTLESNYSTRLKTLNDAVAGLSAALASAQNDAVQSVSDATARVRAALDALTKAQSYFSTISNAPVTSSPAGS